MQLTDLIDRSDEAALTGESIPCRENDAELWFAETPEGVEFAKALCQTCPAIAQCLAGALDRSEPWGVWGGQLFGPSPVVIAPAPVTVVQPAPVVVAPQPVYVAPPPVYTRPSIDIVVPIHID